MSKRASKVFLVLILSIGLVSISMAQRQTGSFSGKVTDDQGILLPGVNVTLSGPSLMGTLTYTTTESGDFRFPAVPPGKEYRLEFELSGFQKVEQAGLICNVGKTFRVDIVLKPATLEEKITVTAAAPTVDVTSTKQAITYSQELIQNIPLERDYKHLLRTMPGVVGGYFRGREGVHPTVYGASGRATLYAVDGVNITDRTMGTQEAEFSSDIIDEVEMGLGAHPAEVALTEGAFVNVVTKSGGNEFHGSAIAYFFNEDMSRSLIPKEEVEAVGLSAPTGFKSLYDFSATFGGPIIKDKFWFFLNGKLSGNTQTNETIADGIYDIPWTDRWGFGKLSFMARSNLKITGMLSVNHFNRDLHRSPSYYTNKYYGYYIHGGQNWIGTTIANWILDQNTFLDFRLQYSYIKRPRYIHPDGPQDTEPTYRDRYYNTFKGAYRFNDDFNRTGRGVTISFNRFLDNFLGGNHEIKMGFDWEDTSIWNPSWRRNPIYYWYTYKGLPWGYNDVQPYMGRIYAYSMGLDNDDFPLKCYVWRWGAYIQDSFTIKDRITFNIGLRFNDMYAGNKGQTVNNGAATNPVLVMLYKEHAAPTIDIPNMDNMISWRSFEPRLGLVFDVFGDHTTALKASFSQYYDYLNMEMYILLTGVHPFGRTMQFYWYDLNQDAKLDLTDGYRIISSPQDPTKIALNEYLNPNLKPGYTNEWIVGIDREVFKDFSVSASYIYKPRPRSYENIELYRGNTVDSGWWVPYTTTEPGWDGKYGTGDDQEITVYGVKKGAPPSQVYMTNPPGIKRVYQAFVLVANKRMSNGWQLLGSLTLSKNEGNQTQGRSSHTGSDFNTPNWLINRYGRLAEDRPVIFKIQSTVLLPLGFMVSAYYSHMSGAPWGRTIQIQLPKDPDTFEYPGTFVETVMAEAPGTRREKATDNLDLRIEKYFQVGTLGRLGFFVDIINVMGERGFDINQNPSARLYTNGTYLPSATYGRFTSAYGLRTFKLSARFTF